MKTTIFTLSGLLGALVLSSGCSVGGAASTGFSIFKNTKANQLGVRIWVDGQEAKRNELKQAATGYSRWKIKNAVSTGPTLKFDFKKPDALGRISNITLSIYQKHEAEYSDHAEFTVFARDMTPGGQMKPNVDYNLSSPGSGFKVIDWQGGEVGGVTLKPGWKYMMVFTVKADDSESAQIFFET